MFEIVPAGQSHTVTKSILEYSELCSAITKCAVAASTHFSTFIKPAGLLLYLRHLAIDPRPGPEGLSPYSRALFI
jgi:hypothetical protein